MIAIDCWCWDQELAVVARPAVDEHETLKLAESVAAAEDLR
jgi:hypothetical protein